MGSADEVVLPSSLMVITDRARSAHALPDALRLAAQGGARWIRVREPDLDLFAYIALCHALIDTVSDRRVTWAVRPGAYAMLRTAYPELRLSVHCPERDALFAAADVSTLVGRSVHAATISATAAWHTATDKNVGATDETSASTPHYLLLAPVYTTESKPDAAPAGVDAIRKATTSDIAVVALGGITPANVSDCLRAGARGVAACGFVLNASDPGARVHELLAALSEHEEVRRGDASAQSWMSGET